MMNFLDGNKPIEITHLDVLAFFENLSRKSDHLIRDENAYPIRCYDDTFDMLSLYFTIF